MKGENFMEFIIYFLTLIVPGLIAAKVYECFLRCKNTNLIANTLIFSLLIFLINITGLYCIKDIYTVKALIASFDCLSFLRHYILLSILIGILLALLFGLIKKCYRKIRCHHNKPMGPSCDLT